jgi:hypothetical protein
MHQTDRCSSRDCAAPLAVCDVTGTMSCVQCTPAESAACAGTTPACVSNSCQRCTAHAQCAASNVCLPDGSCADAAQVAYVQEGGAGTTCTKAAPCGTLADGVNASKPIVKIAPGIVSDTRVATIVGRAVTIVADPGAKVTRSNQGVILQVQNDGADVAIYDLEITAGNGAGNPAISVPSGGAPKLSLTRVTVDVNAGQGISVNAGTFAMSGSTVSFNTGGGITLSGAKFDITNNFIVNNGSAGSPFGGVSIASIVGAAPYRFDFNTLTGNTANGTLTAGLVCSAIAAPLTFANNIVFRNGMGMQVEGTNCAWNYSDIGQAVPGTGNINTDPMFVSVLQDNFHLQATSPARDVADPAATINVDFDGDPRPQGARSDMGADEWKP